MPYYIAQSEEDRPGEGKNNDESINKSFQKAHQLALRNKAKLVLLALGMKDFDFTDLNSALKNPAYNLAADFASNEPFKNETVKVSRSLEMPKAVSDDTVYWVLFPSLPEIKSLTELCNDTVHVVVTEGAPFGRLDEWSKDNNAQKVV
ncbi:hypothetical protein [Tatumella punctata]|uniref:Uncharacterized protein n=1 Tax=Tatumella punctata TaxID=399969 RepID=A0ABW1VS29_9GAMM